MNVSESRRLQLLARYLAGHTRRDPADDAIHGESEAMDAQEAEEALRYLVARAHRAVSAGLRPADLGMLRPVRWAPALPAWAQGGAAQTAADAAALSARLDALPLGAPSSGTARPTGTDADTSPMSALQEGTRP